MTEFPIHFNEKCIGEWNGKVVRRACHIHKLGEYSLRFRIVSTNSTHRQGIWIDRTGFEGKIYMEGKLLPCPRRKFKSHVIPEGTFPDDEFVVKVQAESGSLCIMNAALKELSNVYTCGIFGSAFWMEDIAPNIYRFHCNDYDFDVDFDDMIFEMEIIDSDE